MMLFNLVWFDPIWKKAYPELKRFEEKGKNYTLKDRKALIELNRKIVDKVENTEKCGKSGSCLRQAAIKTKINGGIRHHEMLCKRLSKTAICER